MKVSELIKQLAEYDPNIDVRIMNTAIDEDESCPTFELESIESASDIVRETEAVGFDPDTDIVFLEFSDELHIKDEYGFDYDPDMERFKEDPDEFFKK
jgi:hypothetical protein